MHTHAHERRGTRTHIYAHTQVVMASFRAGDPTWRLIIPFRIKLNTKTLALLYGRRAKWVAMHIYSVADPAVTHTYI